MNSVAGNTPRSSKHPDQDHTRQHGQAASKQAGDGQTTPVSEQRQPISPDTRGLDKGAAKPPPQHVNEAAAVVNRDLDKLQSQKK